MISESRLEMMRIIGFSNRLTRRYPADRANRVMRADCDEIKRQRSFNWQSIAFVMRGLWVQIPPLAFEVIELTA